MKLKEVNEFVIGKDRLFRYSPLEGDLNLFRKYLKQHSYKDGTEYSALLTKHKFDSFSVHEVDYSHIVVPIEVSLERITGISSEEFLGNEVGESKMQFRRDLLNAAQNLRLEGLSTEKFSELNSRKIENIIDSQLHAVVTYTTGNEPTIFRCISPLDEKILEIYQRISQENWDNLKTQL